MDIKYDSLQKYLENITKTLNQHANIINNVQNEIHLKPKNFEVY